MNAAQFKALFGAEPVQDDLERINCGCAGATGHMQCGLCEQHRRPRFACGCIAQRPSAIAYAHVSNPLALEHEARARGLREHAAILLAQAELHESMARKARSE